MPNKTAKQKEKIDFLSLGLLIGSVISLMEAITFMKINLLIISIIFFFLFVWRQRKVQNPFVPFTLFRRKAYVQGVLMGVINTAMNFGVFLITPLLLSQYFGFSGYEIGLVLTPAAIVAALMGKFGGKLTDRLGSRYVLSISIFLLGIGFFLLSSFSGYKAWLLSTLLILTEIGYIFMQPTISKTVSTHLPAEHTGIGMGMFGLLNFLTIAISGTLLTKFIEFKHIGPLNPFSNTDLSGIYSNIYLFFFVLTIVNLIFMFQLTKIRRGVHTK
jgi:DHA2 family metal-tetracycline-proton antiporter-like MFS transporter